MARSDDVKRRAEQVAEMPHVRKWVRAFERLAKQMPKEVFVFCDGNGAQILAKDANGQVMENDNGGPRNSDAEVGYATGPWEGGDT